MKQSKDTTLKTIRSFKGNNTATCRRPLCSKYALRAMFPIFVMVSKPTFVASLQNV